MEKKKKEASRKEGTERPRATGSCNRNRISHIQPARSEAPIEPNKAAGEEAKPLSTAWPLPL
jgi:hypothetical protein